jgi:hypothetical protein
MRVSRKMFMLESGYIITTEVIPGECTKYLQAPDVCWNKPFEGTLHEFCMIPGWLETKIRSIPHQEILQLLPSHVGIG